MNIDVPTGSVLSGYRVERLIGAGATGAVYLARDETLDRPVAIKLLAPELARDVRFQERFLRESRAAARIEHPGIVPIYAAGEADGRLFIAMRYVAGGDLTSVIEREGRMGAAQALALLAQVASGLDAAHEAGLVHRDVKPGNILIESDHAWLADFGLAKHAATVNSLSRDTTFAGTVHYIAPEQIQGGEVDGRADVYALGCVLFECLTGRSPYERDNDLAVVFAHLRDPAPSVSALRDDIPEALDRVIERALAKNPDQRYETCNELIADARTALSGGDVVVPPPGASTIRTFLICDVRGYTRYTQQHGDEAAAELAATFAELVRHVVQRFDGRLIELRGDEALVTFTSARQAVRAALAIQQAVAEAGLPRGVGVGLDTGEAVPVGTGYRGGALNMAARLCSMAEPGQVLASEGVVHLARKVDGTRYLTGQVARLKGIEKPVRVIEVVPEERGDGLRARARRRMRGRRWRRGAVVAGAVAAVGVGAVLVLSSSNGGSARAGTLHAINVLDVKTGEFRAAAATGVSTFSVLNVDGQLWAEGNGVLYKLDPRTHHVVRTVAIGNWNTLATGDGAIWATLSDRPALTRVDARFGATHTFKLPGPGSNDDRMGHGIAVGAGSVWVGQQQQIIRLDPDTLKLQREWAPIPVAEGADIVRYGDGGIYVANKGSGYLASIDPSSDHIVWTSRLHPWLPDVLPAGGTLWVAVDSDAGLHKIDERTGHELGLVPTGAGPDMLSYAGGRVWVDNWRSYTVSSIDPIAGTVRTYHLAGNPTGPVAEDRGDVWVPVQGTTKNLAASVPGKVIRIVEREDWTNELDPAYQWEAKHWQLEYAIEAKLFNYHDPDATHTGSELVPEIAAGLPRISDHGRVYSFTIRPGFGFSPPSHQKVTAATMKFSFERALTGEWRPAENFLKGVVGEQPFLDGQADHISGIVASGNTLTIRLTHPRPDLLSVLAMPFFAAVPIGTPSQGLDLQQTPIPSAGPYYIQSNNDGWWRIVKRNPNYGGDRPRHLDGIVFEIGIDTGPAAKRVEQGTLDFASESYPDSGVFAPGGPISAAYSTRRSGHPWYTHIPTPGTRYFSFDTNRGVFRSAAWRRAVSLAIDRPALAAVNGGIVTDHYMPATLPGVRKQHVYSLTGPTPAALQRARALIGGGHADVILGTCPTTDCSLRARILKKNLAAIGIRVHVQVNAQSPDIADSGWYVDEWDPANVLGFDLFNPDDPGLFSPTWAARVRAAERLPAPARYAAFGKIELQLMRGPAPWAAFEQTADPGFFSARAGCVRFSPVNYGLDIAAMCVHG
jgi:class 3 adenylate cyclase/ABC-type transport system substrate-binding protein/tRNA A-37 threonylcarbamoyl transferase component Bud32/streptogramin lyase